jgi:hypothetical protein
MAADSFNDLSKEDVLGWFDKREIAKAGPYVDLVRDIEIEPMLIRAIVPGTAPTPYGVVVRLMEARGGALLISACTCPVGKHCKHVAAALLRAVDENAPKPDRVSPSVLSWVEDLRRVSLAVAKKKARPASARQQLFYILKWSDDRRHFGIEIRKGKFPESAEEWWKVDRALVTPPQFVNEEDLVILRLIWAERNHESPLRAFGLGPKKGAEILQRLVHSNRLYSEDDLGLPLQAGLLRPASVGWQIDPSGLLRSTRPGTWIWPKAKPDRLMLPVIRR